MPVKFVHAADLHLDRPFGGLREVNPEVGEALRDATLAAYDRVIGLCIDEEVDFAVFAGDLFDSQDRSIRAQVRFVRGLQKLAQAGIPAFIVHGNHDPWPDWSSALEWPALAHRFGSDGVEGIPVERDGKTICQVYGTSFGRGEVKANLARRFKRTEEAPFAVGLLHCDVGAPRGSGYAPCSVEDLRAAGFDYWAIGHIHIPQVIRPADPCIVYPGSTQGLDPTQTGPRGCYVVTLEEGEDPRLDFRATAEAEWRQARLSIDGLGNDEELLRRLEEAIEGVRGEAESKLVLLRLALEGAGPLHASVLRPEARLEWVQALRDLAFEGSPTVWVESLQDETRPAFDLDARAEGDDFVGEFLRLAADARENDAALAEFRQELDELLTEREVDRVFAASDDDLRRWLEQARVQGAQLLIRGQDE